MMLSQEMIDIGNRILKNPSSFFIEFIKNGCLSKSPMVNCSDCIFDYCCEVKFDEKTTIEQIKLKLEDNERDIKR